MQSPPLFQPAASARGASLSLPAWTASLGFCVAVALLWALGLSLTHSAPEADSLEQVVWAHSLQAGYWKHPPLPSWLLAGLMRVFGPSVPLTFFAAQACVAIALFFSWRLGSRCMAPRESFVALLLTSLIAYHNLRADTFNHNTVLLPFQAAMVLAFHGAMRSGRMRQWLLAGVLAGLAMLVKYVALLPLAALGIYVILDKSMHTRRTVAGAVLAAGACLAVFSPHLHWLATNDWMPLQYAQEAAPSAHGLFGTCGELGSFLLMQAVRLLPALLAGWWVLRGARRADAGGGQLPRGSDRLFLWVVGAGPLVLTVAYGLATFTAIPSRWASSAFLLAGWLLVDAARRAVDEARLRRAVQVAVAVQVLLCVGYVGARTELAKALGVRSSANYPLAEIAERSQRAWNEHAFGPLRLVVGSTRVGAAVALHTAPAPAVLIDGEEDRSPGVREDDIDACGALVLIDETTGTLEEDRFPALWSLWRGAEAGGEWRLDWSRDQPASANDTAGSRILWGVIPPGNPAACRL